MRDGRLVLDRPLGKMEREEVEAVYGAAMEEAFA